ncbi:MAG TPA: class III extradiol ring-cleavage dioxygenase [Methylibium sp.]|uniref:DODA-type extradiol aromatic ring-opening family dioxygenase n=1 Tax=Methylibium sp. TaxID=2067992 RepID=UPI002DBF9D6A|nr:class III extradiol ring-cleavage dioxygenase [Methylibium sp.]HEU4458226.1 class III extradiol ring-cleavage dioxygenase [Methylibium sp.]
MVTTLPSIFVSHGSPMLALDPGSTGPFFERLGRAIDEGFGRPRAIVVVSPHTAAARPVLLGAPTHHAVHDFSGFPPELYTLRYGPAGSAEVAQRAAALLQAAGIGFDTSCEPGLDHGIWSVLRFAWPQADVPVLPVALAPRASPAAQWAVGAALAPLRDQGVLLLASGSLTHNLRLLQRGPQAPGFDAEAVPELPESRAFRRWVADRSAAGDRDALLDYRARAPHAALMHPSDEHWLPFFIAAGAGGLGEARRLHAAVTYGCLAMDAYAFGDGATRLSRALRPPGNPAAA